MVLNDIHGLHEHKHISLAVAKAKRTDTIYETNAMGYGVPFLISLLTYLLCCHDN